MRKKAKIEVTYEEAKAAYDTLKTLCGGKNPIFFPEGDATAIHFYFYQEDFTDILEYHFPEESRKLELIAQIKAAAEELEDLEGAETCGK